MKRESEKVGRANMNEIAESAKAIQEVAKAANQGIAVSQHVGSFVARLIGEPLEIASGMISDRLRFARAERLLRLNTRFDDVLKTRGAVASRSVAPKFALPLLEQASLENDDELQDLWANLLASAVDPAFDGSLRSSYIDIASQLEVVDVHLLQLAYDRHSRSAIVTPEPEQWIKHHIYRGPFAKWPIGASEIISELNIDWDLYENSVDNLMRLRCIASSIETKSIHVNDGRQLFEMYDNVTLDHGYSQICITAFGISFVEACLGKRQFSPKDSP